MAAVQIRSNFPATRSADKGERGVFERSANFLGWTAVPRTILAQFRQLQADLTGYPELAEQIHQTVRVTTDA
ncbi:MAG: hypothetical protein KGJ79_18065 [Alphaproteobacteria bacterium]|nr:hypothetical protein [Alphaproteobacteria bacterium]MDE2493673.1 hypothetical protein [Alphaproteobacteria bacterium]